MDIHEKMMKNLKKITSKCKTKKWRLEYNNKNDYAIINEKNEPIAGRDEDIVFSPSVEESKFISIANPNNVLFLLNYIELLEKELTGVKKV